MTLIIVKRVRNDFKKVAGVTLQNVADALQVEAESIMTASKDLYVPVVTGALKNSGTVLKAEVLGDEVKVVLGYGMATTTKTGTKKDSEVTYAEIVHEYPKSYGQKRNKYLSIPANIAIKNMSTRIANDLKRRIKSGKKI
jgi:hypothetical protein